MEEPVSGEIQNENKWKANHKDLSKPNTLSRKHKACGCDACALGGSAFVDMYVAMKWHASKNWNHFNQKIKI